MNTTYESAQNAYSALVERTRGAILVDMPWSNWLERQKQLGMFWGA